MKDRKGFSLIELLAILIIIGLILLFAIPAVSRLLTNNNEKEYNNYLEIIEAGAYVYADSRKDDLGGYKDTGCIEVTLEEIINKNYIKKYEDTKIECTGKVRLNNVKGNLKATINLTCTNRNGKVTFEKTNIDNNTCVAYTPEN